MLCEWFLLLPEILIVFQPGILEQELGLREIVFGILIKVVVIVPSDL